MKKIINNKAYDTSTAREVGSNSYSNPSDFHWWCETLYCKRTGEYFIHGEGGPMSRYSEQIEQNSWSGREKIIPLSYDNARKWAEENLAADEYEREFGDVTEDGTAEVITVSMPATMIAKLRRKAQEEGVSVSALVVKVLESEL